MMDYVMNPETSLIIMHTLNSMKLDGSDLRLLTR